MATNGEMAHNGRVNGVGNGPQVISTTGHLEIVCGPLLNYRRMSQEHTPNPVWHGSVLIVTTVGQNPGSLRLRLANGAHDATFPAVKLYEDPRKAFFN